LNTIVTKSAYLDITPKTRAGGVALLEQNRAAMMHWSEAETAQPQATPVAPAHTVYASKGRIFVERMMYFSLFVVLGASVYVFTQQHAWGGKVWEIYNRVYFLMLLGYTWFIFALLLVGERRKRRGQIYPLEGAQAVQNAKIAVIVPSYNESAELLYKAIRSVILADGNKEIMVVDDGSKDERGKQLMRAFARKFNVKLHFFEHNRGKRHALHYAVTNMINDADFVVTIDSDTVLDRHAFTQLIAPFADPRVGAVTGDVQLLNEKKNWLTRMVGAYYWIGLHIYKEAQSSLGMVVCCSGCLSAYRAQPLRGIIDEFAGQTFFGEPCTHSEDRHLTNLMLKNKWRVMFAPDAVSYTETPSTVRGFLKQQQRWKRGYVRESIYTLTYAWRVRPLLFLEILLWELTIPFFSFGLMLALMFTIITNPMFFVHSVLPAWLTFMVVRYLPMFFYGKRKIPGLLVYMLFYDVFLYWQSIYALFTVRNKSWITR
jgi:hyaluronan synthase